MSLGKRKRKSEHAGAKNGGGHWGSREEAKAISKKVRRSNDKAVIRDEIVRSESVKAKARLADIALRLKKFETQAPLTKRRKAWIECVREALRAAAASNYPVGAVVTNSEFKILSRGRNSVFEPRFHSESHAEMNAISEFETAHAAVKKDGVILFSTLEPCLMCTARILLSGISQVIFLKKDPSGGVCELLHTLPSNYRDLSKRVRFVEHQGDRALKLIAKELYEIGEELWNDKYKL